jgi:hypothetical protein
MAHFLLKLKEDGTEACSPRGNLKVPAGSYLGVSRYFAGGWQLEITEGESRFIGCYQSAKAWKSGNNDVRRIEIWQVWCWRLARVFSPKKKEPSKGSNKKAKPVARNGGD